MRYYIILKNGKYRKIMRKHSLIVGLIIILSLCGCAEEKTPAHIEIINRGKEVKRTEEIVEDVKTVSESEKVAFIYEGETSRGTPIVDSEKSEFSISDVDMMDTPDSSCFSEIGYSSEYSILVVTFRVSGDTYLYLDFSQDEWNIFRDADSLGTYYNDNIKGQYECNKM